MVEPLVSIVMPVYNAERTLTATLRSIFWQTLENWELLLIDDGSTDGTLTLACAAAKADRRVNVIKGKSNTGLALRLNQGVGLARGDYIARLDADDIAYPARLATQVKFLIDNPHCDLVGCSALIFDESGQALGKFMLRLTHGEICAQPWAGFHLPHPTWLGKRAWFSKFGYLPSYLKAQDQDLLLRSYDESQFACVPETLLGYRQERRTLKKLLIGRTYFSRSIVREAIRRRTFAKGLKGLLGQGVKASVDLVTVPLALDRLLRGESPSRVSPSESSYWRELWLLATSESG